ncbi:hypothetical protein B9Z55_027709 [Caenorhabditis nigoni]|uniref:Uncharacterized protein n=2 Tax=Caenorhabditis nigoni TaxID=1611254 RepID=A0A2G5SFF1_9PELO|nr:hypothetical protein B9Z55_027709 [Caenorhabditis nigoni]
MLVNGYRKERVKGATFLYGYRNHHTCVVSVTFIMNNIYTAEFDENRALPVMVYANALCTYVQQLAPDHADDVAKVCINIKNSHEYFLRKSMETSQPNTKEQIGVIQDNVADIADLKAENDKLTTKVRELELEKKEADARVASMFRLVELKSTEASQVTANPGIPANEKCEKDRDIDELNDFLRKTLEKSWANVDELMQVHKDQKSKIDALKANVKQLEFDKSRADAKIAKFSKLVDLKDISQLTAQGRIFANQKVEKNRDVNELNAESTWLKEELKQMKDRCRTYAAQLHISTQENSELEHKLETLTLHGPAYEEPVIKNGQSEKEQLVEQVKEDNEQLEKEKDTHKEKFF